MRTVHTHRMGNANKRMIGNVVTNENIQKKELYISKKEFDIIQEEFRKINNSMETIRLVSTCVIGTGVGIFIESIISFM